jgi:hypothetical protein
MIVNKDTNPERDVYYLGAKIIEIIDDEPEHVDFFYLYRKVQLNERISMNLYSLTLDWLYIIGAIENSGKGNIRKCF